MSAERITYWNSRMRNAQRLTREQSGVTVRTFRCGCKHISEHSDVAQLTINESCEKHKGAPHGRPRLIERFV